MRVLLTSIIFISSYLIGAIPSGAWIARFNGIKDISRKGSGNIGATNVARLLGIGYFFLVFLLDAGKAFSLLKIIQYFDITKNIQILAAIGLVLGNSYSIFFQWRGGKGVATSVGIMLALIPSLIPILLAIWLCVLIATKTVGLASIISLVSVFVIIAWQQVDISLSCLMAGMSMWGIYRHKENIRKFLNNNSKKS
ncbi:MAG: glycerol-3-phosphate 1-O-acyltransferase PlsY [Candidatus Babeliales bacterium]